MINPITKSLLWNTPTIDQLAAMIESLPIAERQIAYQYALMTMNMCHQMVEDANNLTTQ